MTDLAPTAERFARETAEHKMTVLHDDGLYRHLRFRSPKNGFYWFSLVTTPGSLIFQGDGESFVFSRMEDMFEFFRGQRVNPGYWAEKLTSGDRSHDHVMRYERSLFMAKVNQTVREAIEDNPGLEGLAAAVHAGLADADGYGELDDESYARRWLDDFEFYIDEHADRGGRSALIDGRYQWVPPVPPDFRFVDTWEWDFRDYNWWFLWALHAIVWGIAQYDQAKGQYNYDVAALLAPEARREARVPVSVGAAAPAVVDVHLPEDGPA